MGVSVLMSGDEQSKLRQTLQPCPLPGVYQLTLASSTSGGGKCVHQMDLGCRNSSVVYVESGAVCTNNYHPPPFRSPGESITNVTIYSHLYIMSLCQTQSV